MVNTTIEYASTNQTALLEYGITEQMLTDYSNDLRNYKDYLTKPEEIKAEKKTATAQLKVLFKDLSDQLNEHLDNHMMQYRISKPEFYSDYENARIIYDDPTISKSLMGSVSDKSTGEVLQYVEVTVKYDPATGIPDKTKNTSEKGNYQFKNLPAGMISVEFKKNYYDTLTVNSEIHENAMTRLNVQIMKTVG